MPKKRSVYLMLAFSNLIIGMMIAAQYQSTREPVQSESRDITQLRVDLQKEMERHKQLLSDISKYDQLLYQYETSLNEQETVNIMYEELQKVRALAGFASVKGPGVIINIEEDKEFLQEYGLGESDLRLASLIVDEDLRTLVNELFYSGAQAISVNGLRFTTTTAVRNVGNQIQINNRPVQLPYEIRAVGDPGALFSAMEVAGMKDYFKIVNKKFNIKKVDQLIVPAYWGENRITYMKPLKKE